MTGWLLASRAIHYMSRLVSPLRRYFLNLFVLCWCFENRDVIVSSWDGMEVRYNDSIPRSHVISFTPHTIENSHSWGRRDDNGKAVSVVVGCLSHRHRHHKQKPTTLDRSGLYMCNCLKSSAFVATSFIYIYFLFNKYVWLDV